MTRYELESNFGKKVRIVTKNGKTFEGVLKPESGYLYVPSWYLVGEERFRLSHVKKMEVINND